MRIAALWEAGKELEGGSRALTDTWITSNVLSSLFSQKMWIDEAAIYGVWQVVCRKESRPVSRWCSWLLWDGEKEARRPSGRDNERATVGAGSVLRSESERRNRIIEVGCRNSRGLRSWISDGGVGFAERNLAAGARVIKKYPSVDRI